LARIIAMPPFAAEFFGGQAEWDVPAGNIFELIRELDARAPGFAASADSRLTVAVDGVVTNDWSTRLSDGSEVLLVPRIAGGVQHRHPLEG
jgi:molybdopterin converting factor small subunit